jgi:hypothetical protein
MTEQAGQDAPLIQTELISPQKPRTFFHPFSGFAILAFDWIFFGTDIPSVMIFLPITCMAAFGVTFITVYKIQQKLHGDDIGWARAKALIGAVAAAVPFPIAGTIVGAAILFHSGLPTNWLDAARRLLGSKNSPK